eukprot:TRINITY_DN2282_c0_g1_i8.p4 TRINITY_DN2282_c0_g1~~TRINITY_DN2282_c0_g1_i8.p4  ORF type:complete len:123 (-),score=6.17 TRINITY_DN2282_c0_g1_i8:782-1150(-)
MLCLTFHQYHPIHLTVTFHISMKPWHKFAIGAAITSLGAAAYLLSRRYLTSSLTRLNGTAEPSAGTTAASGAISRARKINVCRMLDEVVAGVIKSVAAYVRIAGQMVEECGEEVGAEIKRQS